MGNFQNDKVPVKSRIHRILNGFHTTVHFVPPPPHKEVAMSITTIKVVTTKVKICAVFPFIIVYATYLFTLRSLHVDKQVKRVILPQDLYIMNDSLLSNPYLLTISREAI